MQAFTTQEVPLGDRLFGWWYRIAAPPDVPDEAPPHLRMRVRSGKLTSVVFLIEILIVLGIMISVTMANRIIASPASLIVLICLVVGTILNRKGKTVTAGILILVIEEMSIIGTIFLVDQRASLSALLNTFLLIGPELIAAEMIAPWVTLPITLGNCLVTIGMLTFLTKGPELVPLLHESPYFLYAVPLEIQILAAVICFLWVSSTYREMRRANSAEEVSKLTLEIARQQQVVQVEKQQLEESIQQIVSVHMQAANGNLNARVPLDRQNILWAIAGSLNNLLARLQRWRYDAVQLQKNEQALQQLIYQVQTARKRGEPLKVYTTGTSLDAVIFEISKGIAAPQRPPN